MPNSEVACRFNEVMRAHCVGSGTAMEKKRETVPPGSCPAHVQGELRMVSESTHQFVHLLADSVTLEGELTIPAKAHGVVAFAHGSGSSRHSPRNTFVAQVLQSAGLGTLLFDLLTREEEATYETRFDIDLLT